MYTMGRYLALRGSKEHHILRWTETSFGTFHIDDGNDLFDWHEVRQCQDSFPQDKQTNSKMTSAASDDTHLLNICESIEEDNLDLDSVAIVTKYIAKSHPDAEFSYSKPLNAKQITSEKLKTG